MTEQEHNDKIKHLDYIQATITRMSTASFSIKTATVALCGAVIGLMPKAESSYLNGRLFLFLIPIATFWYLDTYYLIVEKCFRDLYDHIRSADLKTDFSMDTSAYRKNHNFLKIMIKPPLSVLYLVVALSILIFYLSNIKAHCIPQY